jgi:integrase
MARKLGQIIARGQSTWLVRVYLGRDPQTGTRKYHNHTVHGSFREAQRFLNLKPQQRDNGRVSRVAVLSLNQLLDQWLTTAVKARVRTKTFKDYEALLKQAVCASISQALDTC